MIFSTPVTIYKKKYLKSARDWQASLRKLVEYWATGNTFSKLEKYIS
jgi:hypothetical protein